MGLALSTALKLCTSMAKGLKLKVWKFLGLIFTLVKVKGEKLVLFVHPQSSIGLEYYKPYLKNKKKGCETASITDNLSI